MSDFPAVSPNVGTRLLFENERVRVWDLQLDPGASTGFHRHDRDYLYIVVGDGVLQTVYPDGREDPPRSMKDGDVRFRRVGEGAVHAAVNRGSETWRNLVVELKANPNAPVNA